MTQSGWHDSGFGVALRLKHRVAELVELARWLATGRQPPSPRFVKQRTVRGYARRFGLTTLIETGTFQGAMIASVKRVFSRIVSIELDATLYRRARSRFDPYPHIEIVRGDSAVALAHVVRERPEPCVFWLDAHYSGGETAHGDRETPIEAEVAIVLARKNPKDVILIDDARLFTGGSYPSREQLHRKTAASHLHHFEVRDDIIRIHS